jgi:LCP family protein required for cell wall assembly
MSATPSFGTSAALAVRRRRGRTWLQRGVIALNVALILASLLSAWALWLVWNRAESINRVSLDRSLSAIADAEPGERVINVLLVGSDSSAGLDPDDPVQIDRQGERFGDVIIIAHIDERSGSVALLSLPRDLWVEIGDTGRDGRINRAFVNGGPALLIETIERQFGVPIHHYVNVDFAGFRGLVEAVGSVEVWFDTPARDWNVNARPVPRTQTGFVVETAGCHSLDAEMALAYVRSRYYQTQDENGRWRTDPTADLGRIRRQQDFLRRAMSRAIEVGARNPFVLRDLIDTGLEHVAIDQELTPQFLVDLGGLLRSFEPDDLQTYSFPNRPTTIGANQVLLPRTDEADAVLELFRGAGFDAPATVDLRLLRDDTVPATVLRQLRQAGFEPTLIDTDDELVSGTVVRHGPD